MTLLLRPLTCQVSYPFQCLLIINFLCHILISKSLVLQKAVQFSTWIRHLVLLFFLAQALPQKFYFSLILQMFHFYLLNLFHLSKVLRQKSRYLISLKLVELLKTLVKTFCRQLFILFLSLSQYF